MQEAQQKIILVCLIINIWFIGDSLLFEVLFDIKFLANNNKSERVKKILNSIILVKTIGLLGFIVAYFLAVEFTALTYMFLEMFAINYLVLRIAYGIYSLFKKIFNRIRKNA